MATKMISTGTSRVIRMGPKDSSGVIESRSVVMFEGLVVRATFVLHWHELRSRLLMRPSQV